MKSNLRLTGATMLMVAGLACSAVGQNVKIKTDDTRVTIPATAANTDVYFVDCDKLSGEDVVNPNGETVAAIDNLIVDRGSGRVVYAILKSGAVLGLGGKKVAVPYAALTYDRARERFSINMTEEQIERAASFSPDDWSNLEHTTWTEDLENWWDETFVEDDADDEWGDPYADSLTRARSANRSATSIDGTITRVVRERHGASEYACVEIKDDDGSIKHVILGPSWYVMGHKGAPMRGNSIEVEGVEHTSKDGRNSYIAMDATIEGERLELRDKEGSARWRVPTEPTDTTTRRDGRIDGDGKPVDGKHVDGKHDKESRAAYRDGTWGSGQLMLISDLNDAPASANDASGGEIQQIILEETSGHIAFIGFDPNENVLGIADDIVLVPWSLVRVDSTHEARIDANKDMLVASQEVPDDLGELSNQDRLARIYDAYGVEAQTFYDRRDSMSSAKPTSQWNSDGKLMRAFRDGKELTFSGRIVEVRHETLLAGEADAIVLVVDTDDGQRTVVVGPSWYMTRQRVDFKSGDPIMVVGTSGTVDGKELIGAREVKSGERKIVLWSDDNPVWNDD